MSATKSDASTNTRPPVRVRVATKEDCAQIIRLIQDLADYEKMPDGPKIGAKSEAEKSQFK